MSFKFKATCILILVVICSAVYVQFGNKADRSNNNLTNKIFRPGFPDSKKEDSPARASLAGGVLVEDYVPDSDTATKESKGKAENFRRTSALPGISIKRNRSKTSNTARSDSNSSDLTPFTRSANQDPLSPSRNRRRVTRQRANSLYAGVRSSRNQNLSPDTIRSLPEAIVGESYCTSIDPQWGKAPHTLRLVRGPVPVGLRFNSNDSTLCGTPEEEGLSLLVFSVTDASTESANISFRLVIKAEEDTEEGDLKILSTFLTPGTIGATYSERLEASGGLEPLLWEVLSLPEGLELDPFSGLIGGTPLESGEFILNLKVIDAEGNEALAILDLIIRPSPLFITTGSLGKFVVGENLSVFLEAQGGEPPYLWSIISGGLPEGVNFNPQSGSLAGSAFETFNSTIRFEVRDQLSSSDRVDLPFIVDAAELSILTKSLPKISVGENFLFQLEAQGGVPPYVWNVSSGSLPNEFAVTENGLLSGSDVLPGEYNFGITVQDQVGTLTTQQLSLIVEGSPLEVISTNIPVMNLCENYSAVIEAKGGLPPYRWSLVNGELPSGLSFEESGSINGVVDKATSGLITVRVRDANREMDQKSLAYAVQSNPLEVITALVLPEAIQGEEYSEDLQVRGSCGDVIWRITNGTLPSGLTLNPQGIITGLPSESGNFPFDVTVEDTSGRFKTASFVIVVAAEELSISPGSLPAGEVDKNYFYRFTATGGVPPYSWGLASGSLPAGLVVRSSLGELTGVPTEPGEHSFELVVTDAAGLNAFEPFELEIAPAPLKILTGSSELAIADVGVQYEVTLNAEGGVLPYQWSIVGGGLPPGISLSDPTSGTLSGIPTTPGDFSFQARVRDSENQTDTKQLVITVEGEALGITSSRVLPEARVGLYYEFNLAAAGGVPPYLWFHISGALPAGLTFLSPEGIIQGTPSEAGTVNDLVFLVEDEVGIQVSDTFTLTTQPNNLEPVLNLVAATSNQLVGLAWQNPVQPEFISTKVVRNQSGVPQDPSDGVEVYFGTNTNVVDQGLENGTQYFYAAFAYYGDQGFAELDSTGQASATPHAVAIDGEQDPFVDELILFSPLNPDDAFGSQNLPQVVLGPPLGSGEYFGSTDVVSLHAKINDDGGQSAPYGGSIELAFNDNIVINAAGPDLTVFENAFRIMGTENYWLEPAVVEVSIDGQNYYRFPFDFVPHYTETGELDLQNPFSYATGFAGIQPVYSNAGTPDPTNPALSGGDQFDLSDITEKNLNWIRYIRIIATGHNWFTDTNGDLVPHPDQTGSLSGTGNSGFDLDAVTAINY